MRLTQEQTQTQRLTQTATAQQVILSHLLELPADALEAEVVRALEENPALERAEMDDHLSDFHPDDEGRNAEDDYGSFDDNADGVRPDAMADESRTVTGLDEYFATREREYRSTHADYDSDDDTGNDPSWLADTTSATDLLLEQIADLDLDDTERRAMTFMVMSLDEKGYLDMDDYTLATELAVNEYINLSEAELHRLVGLLQGLEPAGIGAHDLRECLMLQLRALQRETAEAPLSPKRQATLTALDTALRVLDTAFDDYVARFWERIERTLGLTPDMLTAADAQIRRCTPHPLGMLEATQRENNPKVVPDFILAVNEMGRISVELTRQHEPRLKVSHTFRDIVENYDPEQHRSLDQQEGYVYAKDLVDRATNFIENLRRRREMLLKTMRDIAHCQQAFFLGEDDDSLLQPLKMQDVAEHVGVDVSTISRTAASKYVETAYGIYPLRYFFNSQTMEKDGTQVSSTLVKAALRELVEGEDPENPLSDNQLVALLAEQGYKIARRTVVKYRDKMGIPTAQMRKTNPYR